MRSAILLAAMIIGDAILPNQPLSQGSSANAINIILLIFGACDGYDFFDKFKKGVNK